MKIYAVKHSTTDGHESNMWYGKCFLKLCNAEEYISEYNDNLTPFEEKYNVDRNEWDNYMADLFHELPDTYDDNEFNTVFVTRLAESFNTSYDLALEMYNYYLNLNEGECYAEIIELNTED